VDVLNKGKIEALKMGGLLAVNRGSVDPPFLYHGMESANKANSKPIVLSGKGIYDYWRAFNIKTEILWPI